jgi:hypothetical protein
MWMRTTYPTEALIVYCSSKVQFEASGMVSVDVNRVRSRRFYANEYLLAKHSIKRRRGARLTAADGPRESTTDEYSTDHTAYASG